MAMGCACGGMDSIAAGDLEQNILDYLNGKHGSNPVIAGLLRDKAGYVEGQSGRVADLLRALATQAVPQDILQPILDDLGRTIASFEELHRGGLAPG